MKELHESWNGIDPRMYKATVSFGKSITVLDGNYRPYTRLHRDLPGILTELFAKYDAVKACFAKGDMARIEKRLNALGYRIERSTCKESDPISLSVYAVVVRD